MIDHFHIHCLIPAGVLSFDGRRWVESKEDFMFHVKPLAKEMKKRYLTIMETNRDSLDLPADWSARLQKAWEKKWIVYAKKPFAGPKQVLDYLGRYTHRIAISNHRIKTTDNDRITFTYKDRSNDNRTKTMELSAMEFIRRFLLHVLPKRFMKIRYYGFLANVNKKKAVLLIRRLIGKFMEVVSYGKESIREKMLRLTGRDILCCPHCGKGTLQLIQLIYADSG